MTQRDRGSGSGDRGHKSKLGMYEKEKRKPDNGLANQTILRV